MTKIKICGITNLEDARLAIKYGADILGFNFYPKSPRYIAPGSAKSIIEKLNQMNQNVQAAGVFVNEDSKRVRQISVDTLIDIVQFHGDESPRDLQLIRIHLGLKVIKALRKPEHVAAEYLSDFEDTDFLLDGYSAFEYGGTGKTADQETAKRLVTNGYTLYLAGGLNAKNVGEAIQTVRPYAVDVASGVESSAGKKDVEKMKRFIEAVRNAE